MSSREIQRAYLVVYDQQLCYQFQQLEVDERLTQQRQLETEETPQQVMRQLTHEQEATNRRTREMEEEIRDLQQRVSKLIFSGL